MYTVDNIVALLTFLAVSREFLFNINIELTFCQVLLQLTHKNCTINLILRMIKYFGISQHYLEIKDNSVVAVDNLIGSSSE